jgi:uncharacterized protein
MMWIVRCVVLLILVVLSPVGYAQEQPELGQQDLPAEASGVQPQTELPDFLKFDAKQGNYSILSIGDGLGGGLGAGMTRLSEGNDAIEITNRFNESSGIARPEIYDWADSIEKITEGKTFDAVVVMLGSNDRQDIRLGEFRYRFNTPEWLTSYGLQLDTVLDVMKSKGMQIYWVSVPPMADKDYNDDMTMLNTLFKERVEAKAGVFLDIRPYFLTPEGSYTDRGLDETGAIRKLRASDGVNFFKAGNNRMAQLVLAAIEERRKGGAAAVNVTPVAPAEAVPAAPILGQSLGGGVSESYEATDIVVAMAAQPARPKAEALTTETKPAVATRIIDVVAASGTNAEKFLTTGVSPPAPPGRFDDFSTTVVPAN